MAAALELVRGGADVSLLEAGAQLGGNCLGVDVPLPGGGSHRIDAGVSDFNRETFVRFGALLEELGLETDPIGQDASVCDSEGRTRWFSKNGIVRGEGAERHTDELRRFNAQCVEVLEGTRFEDWTLEQYRRDRGFSIGMFEELVFPRAVGCFAMPCTDPRDFSIRSLIAFWNMHGLVGRTSRPPRRAVRGGMHRYCRAMRGRLERYGAQVRTATRVIDVARTRSGLVVRTVDRDDRHSSLPADRVVVATMPRAALAMIDGLDPVLRSLLSRVPTQRARVLVHTDRNVMPTERRAWGAYNFSTAPRGPSITFHPNLIAELPPELPDVFVSMNPVVEPDPSQVIAQRFFAHPIGTPLARRLAHRIERHQGQHGIWFCGSYLRDPFLHEQAIASGQDAAHRLLETARRAA